MDSEESVPQLRGVVIITLPPPDNPSLGKTITAFTVTNDSPQPHQTPQENDLIPQEQNAVPELPLQSPPVQFYIPRPLFDSPRKLFGLLGIAVLALLLYSSVFSHTVQELRNSKEDREDKKTLIFPLYRKSSVPENDIEFKLGRAVASIYADKKNINKKSFSANTVGVDSSSIFPVRGSVYPDGLYFTYMLVGSPPRPYYLDIDTGSDLTWIQCDAPCSSCAKGANPLYKPRIESILPSKDPLCKEIQRNQKGAYCEACQCDYEIEYADRSSSMGVLARDELQLMITNGSLTKLNVVFGCAYDQQGLLLNTLVQTDGILGLSRAKVSLPSQLASQKIINNVVGHCLATDAGSGGYMFLGDDLVPNWGMAWVPMLDSPSIDFYHTAIVKMSYGSSLLSLGGWDSQVGRALFDTGSSYTYFTKQAYIELVASLKEVSNMGLILDSSDSTLPLCWRAKLPIRSVMDVKQYFKTLTLQFGSKWWIASTKLRIPPEGYLIVSKKGNICLGILDGSEVHDGSTIILGDISMRGQLIVYDNINQRIGWAKSDCVKPRRIKTLPFFEGSVDLGTK
ncbi:aspartyl protease APCB1 isoform X2 [Pistacia vera]|uniref:aspartyl protease APCB1 isoform X2 n=1 Tax=Pistacia vera TaxID=55513 RepID=UPI00126337C5|nr:aspartyl protease APCB1 isoform X2 [Pistacia vera]